MTDQERPPLEAPYVILGCGYTGMRLAQALRADGVAVRACARRLALLEPLRQLGATVHYLDAAKPRQLGIALHGPRSPVVVYSIPGVPDLPPGACLARPRGRGLVMSYWGRPATARQASCGGLYGVRFS